MPCYADTIVKVNQVRQTCNEDSKLVAIRAVGVYPIESEDCELDMTLFIPINDEERDPNTHSIFETNEYYCVGGKVVLGHYNGNLRLKLTVASSTHLLIKRELGSNRCPLKVSFVGVAQDVPKEIDRENAIINVLVNDYAGQIYSFTIKVVFPCNNSRFKHLMNSTRLNESVLFVVGQMEIIEKGLYVYTVDISYVDTGSTIKKKSSFSESTPALFRSVCSRLLNAHQSISEDSSKAVEIKSLDLGKERYDDEGMNNRNKESTSESDKFKEGTVYDSKSLECSYERSDNGKKKLIQPVIHNTRKRSELSRTDNSNEKA
ncbi:2285_t:CDS:2 [Racocetra persica]|uniref:2285_t:CDS:1 n=1 Tax=Racocetra persica TaxID=160502 RepID=A0ACA9LGY6_9GLOM|nr:2285_t:CDS:2 [Racocetra persica]